MSVNELLRAIVDNEPTTVKRLLRVNALLMQQPKLYQSGIFHWLYVGDTALHLAAAGYRVEIAKLLLAAGADPNATRNRQLCG